VINLPKPLGREGITVRIASQTPRERRNNGEYSLPNPLGREGITVNIPSQDSRERE